MTTEPQAFAGLGKLDAGKLDDLVTSVWDHKDEVGAAVTFVRDHGDELLALVGRLPELMASASSALTEAAGDTRATAQFLTGQGDQAGVKHLADAAADALDACRNELNDVRSMLDSAARALQNVPLVGLAAQQIADGVAHFDQAGAQLAEVAVNLRGIGGAVEGAGGGLARTADKLEGGAKALGSLGAAQR